MPVLVSELSASRSAGANEIRHRIRARNDVVIVTIERLLRAPEAEQVAAEQFDLMPVWAHEFIFD